MPEDDNPGSEGERKTLELYAASLVANLVFGGAIAVAFYFLGSRFHLFWTTSLVFILGVLAVLVILNFQFVRFKEQLSVLALYLLALSCSFYLEAKQPIPVTPKPPPEPTVTEVAIDDLRTTFSGFRKNTGSQDFVILEIKAINYERSRTSFSFSLNERLNRTVGQGLVYSATSNLQLSDGTLLKYKREDDGRITLRSINGSGYFLRQEK